MEKYSATFKITLGAFLAASIAIFVLSWMTITYGNEKLKANKIRIEKVKHENSLMRTPISYSKSSETVPYPNLKEYSNLWVKVSIPKQKVYIMNGSTQLYEMYASTGKDSVDKGKTPKGTFHIQPIKTDYFYSPVYKEGAMDGISFKDDGVYLFHSTPVNKNKKVIKSDAESLGKRASSHGCIHLSFSDAHWFKTHIMVGTKIVIK